MKTKKTQLRFFGVTEWEREQEYLRDMHRKGWKLVRCSPPVYRFVRCEPEDVVYQLDYNPEGAKQRLAYIRMFEDCGWEYLTDCGGYSYFRKPVAAMDGEEEIFCDDASRMDMIRRVFRGRILPMLVIFVCTVVQLLLHISEPIVFAIFLVLLALYLVAFARFVRLYRRMRSR